MHSMHESRFLPSFTLGRRFPRTESGDANRERDGADFHACLPLAAAEREDIRIYLEQEQEQEEKQHALVHSTLTHSHTYVLRSACDVANTKDEKYL